MVMNLINHLLLCIIDSIAINHYNDLEANKLVLRSKSLTLNGNGDSTFESANRNVVSVHLRDVYADASICVIDNMYVIHSNSLKNREVVVDYIYY